MGSILLLDEKHYNAFVAMEQSILFWKEAGYPRKELGTIERLVLSMERVGLQAPELRRRAAQLSRELNSSSFLVKNEKELVQEAISKLESVEDILSEPPEKVSNELRNARSYSNYLVKHFERINDETLLEKYLDISERLAERTQDQLSKITYSSYRAVILARNGEGAKAEETIREYFKHHEKANNAIVLSKQYYWFGTALDHGGDSKRAMKWYQKSVNCNPWREIRASLRSSAGSFLKNAKNLQVLNAAIRERESALVKQQVRSESILVALGVAGFLAVLGGLFWQRMMAKQKQELEALVKMRTLSLSQTMKKVQAADQAKTEFVARMNHEIRNPLTAILSFIDILHRKVGDDVDSKACLDGLQSSSRHLHDLVTGVLEVTAAEENDSQLSSLPFNLKTTIQSVFDILVGNAQEKNLSFNIELANECEHLVGDEAKLRQVLINLVSNAIKFTDTGSVVMSVESKLQEESRCLIVVNVVDTGCGMPKDEMHLAFEKFAVTSSGRRLGGSGLGLYISKLLTEKMGGSIQLSSEVGVGTNVTVRIPFDLQQGVEIKRESESSECVVDVEANRVLVVDDQELVRKGIHEQLDSRGYEVASTENPLEVRRIVENFDPAVILLDIRMPKKSGYEVLRDLQRMRETPVAVAVTGDVTDETKVKCEQAGFDLVLFKPFREAELVEMVQAAFDVKNRRDELSRR